jgi:hypothetical protein
MAARRALLVAVARGGVARLGCLRMRRLGGMALEVSRSDKASPRRCHLKRECNGMR